MTHQFDGSQYEKAATHQKEWGSALIRELKLTGRERILDLGCGDGGLTAQLADRVPDGGVLGIDSSPSMLDTAAKHRRDNLVFRLMDISALDFDDEFDLVFSNATLQWIKDHGALLGRVLRALRAGGQVRFNFAADGNCSTFIDVVRDAMSRPPFDRFFRDFDWPWYMPSVEEYGTLVGRFPFAESRVWGENADRYFPNAEAMVRWIDQPSLVPFLARLSERHRSALRDQVVTRMLERAARPDGTYFETFRRVNLSARKEGNRREPPPDELRSLQRRLLRRHRPHRCPAGR